MSGGKLNQFSYLLTFKGRMKRLPFLFIQAIIMTAGIIDRNYVMVSLYNYVNIGGSKAQFYYQMGAATIFASVLLYLWFATTVKRLHDINLSGNYAVIAAIPYINLLLLLYLIFAPPKDDEC